MKHQLGGFLLAALGIFAFMGTLWHLQRGQREGRFYYGRQHRYVTRGESEYDGLVINHRMMLGFFPFIVVAGLVVAVRRP